MIFNRYPTETHSVTTIAINPYELPTEHVAPGADSTTAIRTRVARPATAFIVMVSIQSFLVVIYLVSAAVVVARGGFVSHDYVGLVVATIQLAGLVLIAISGAKLGFLESLTLARLGGCLLAYRSVNRLWLWGYHSVSGRFGYSLSRLSVLHSWTALCDPMLADHHDMHRGWAFAVLQMEYQPSRPSGPCRYLAKQI